MLKIDDVTPYPEVGQHWAILDSLRLAQVLAVHHPSANEGTSVPSVNFKTWCPSEVQNETWILPVVRSMMRYLWCTSLLAIRHFPWPPSEGSVWVISDTGTLFFVGAKSTEYPDKVWVYTDWNMSQETDEIAQYIREIQSGPEPASPPGPSEPTAIEQLLADD